MNTRIAAIGLALGAAAALSGCSTTNKQASVEYTTMGEALRQTMAAQVVDPDPRYAEPDPAGSAEKAAQAVERYRKGTVRKPERVRSSGTGSGGN